jgi:pimeloyl-ACP methyl ester carboxylesterase
MSRIADITGRYVYVTVEGIEYRLYFEEAGQGIPLICQHTAGSDGRQYRHLLEDPDITEHFRVIVHDLPYHGKSLPPFGVRWWEQEYKLTEGFFKKLILSLSDALALEDPVFMGCSMGGHLAADLALNHPDRFRACIALEGALESHAIQGVMPWWNHPRLGNDSKPSLMYTMMAPQSPEPSKRETIWMYSQGAPPVFYGDLNYYGVDYDTTGTAQDIDTSKVGLHVLSGEYDWSAYPGACEALSRKVEGSTYTLMRRMGHFPMSENPEEFKGYLMPVLERIRGTST